MFQKASIASSFSGIFKIKTEKKGKKLTQKKDEPTNVKTNPKNQTEKSNRKYNVISPVCRGQLIIIGKVYQSG